jgi:hypothetical protein
MAEAYMLAGELHGCGGDYRAAFARYQARLLPFLRRKQENAARLASSFAPKTPGIAFRNLVTYLAGADSVHRGFLHRTQPS